MAGVNKVILIGNCGRDPELRYSANNVAILNLNIATTESRRDRNSGEWQDRTEWHRVIVFSDRAERLGKSLHKGSRVYVEGRLQTREWEKDGVKRYTTEIVANYAIDLSARSDQSPPGGRDEQQAPPQEGESRPAPAPKPQQQQNKQESAAPVTGSEPPESGNFDDEIPF